MIASTLQQEVYLASTQHKNAKSLLKIIPSASTDGRKLTYARVAELMGRPRNHARTIASSCNLLDAAACLAGVPLLALVKVLAEGEIVNPDAFWEYDAAKRQQIIERSLQHKFTVSDYSAVRKALDNLQGKGALKAWKFIEETYQGDLMFRRLIGDYTSPNTNAIRDIGSDEPDRTQSLVWNYERDPLVRTAVLKRSQGRCEYCGELGFLKSDGTRYLETHHVIALANQGKDREANVIALCPNDHREVHFGAHAEVMETLMIKKLESF